MTRKLYAAGAFVALAIVLAVGVGANAQSNVWYKAAKAYFKNAVTIESGGLTVTAGGVTATAGGLTATAGGLTATAGNITATAGNIVATAGDINLGGNDLTATGTGQTFNIASAANDVTVSTTTGAITLKSSVDVTNGDLVLNVENSAGDNLLTVDEQGLLTTLTSLNATTDVNLAGNDVTCTGTGQTCNIVSAANDVTVSTTTGAITLKSSVNVTDGDLILAVLNSASDLLASITEQGAFTALTSITGTTTVKGTTGLIAGSSGTTIEDSYSVASTAIDFAGVTDQCEDSGAITVTGAAVGDICTVGPPDTMPCAHCWVTCYVSASDAVKVRLCGHGASGDPASANYSIRVFDP